MILFFTVKLLLALTLLKCGANLFALDSGAETFSVIIFESALKLKLKLKLKCATSQGHPHSARQNYTYAGWPPKLAPPISVGVGWLSGWGPRRGI